MTLEEAGTAGSRSTALADIFVTVADTLVDDYDVVDLMDQLVTACAALFDVQAAGLLLVDQRGGLRVVASSSEQAGLLELFQLQSDEGPCLDCISSGQPVTLADIDQAGGRWPRFVEAARAGGFTSVYAVPMRLRKEVIGALNLFGDARRDLDDDHKRQAQALADVATIGILQQRSIHRSSILAENLQRALNTRIVVEQAKGILAERGNLPMGETFDVLRSYARSHNLKLSDLAHAVVYPPHMADAVLAEKRPPAGR
jgi:transcriptional regulator with GAF, ATPase, and Fis domain